MPIKGMDLYEQQQHLNATQTKQKTEKYMKQALPLLPS